MFDISYSMTKKNLNFHSRFFHTHLIMLYNRINKPITSISDEDNVLISGECLHGLHHAARSHI